MSPRFDHIQSAAVAVHSTHHAAQMPGHCGRPLHATVVCMVLNCPDFAFDSVSDIATVTPHAERIWGIPQPTELCGLFVQLHSHHETIVTLALVLFMC